MTNNNKNTNNQNNDFMAQIQSMFNQTGIGQDLRAAIAEADRIVNNNKKDNKK